MSFSTRITIAFGDTDPAGLVYYPNLFHYCHVAMERFVGECARITYSDLLRDQRIGFPTVRVQAEFMVPIVYGDEIDVEVQVSGNRQFITYSRLLDQAFAGRSVMRKDRAGSRGDESR